MYWFSIRPNWVNGNPAVLLAQQAAITHLNSCSTFSSAHGRRRPSHLQANLLIHGDRPVAEGDGVAEAGLPLDGPLGHVHDDLRALGAGVEEQGNRVQPPTGLHGQAALGFVVASVGRGGDVQSVCEGKSRNTSLNKYIIRPYMRRTQKASL